MPSAQPCGCLQGTWTTANTSHSLKLVYISSLTLYFVEEKFFNYSTPRAVIVLCCDRNVLHPTGLNVLLRNLDQDTSETNCLHSDVVVKLLLTTLAMIVVPLGSYFVTLNLVFRGKSRSQSLQLPYPQISICILSNSVHLFLFHCLISPKLGELG